MNNDPCEAWTVTVFEVLPGMSGYVPLRHKTLPNIWGMKPTDVMLVKAAKNMMGLKGTRSTTTRNNLVMSIFCKQAKRLITIQPLVEAK